MTVVSEVLAQVVQEQVSGGQSRGNGLAEGAVKELEGEDQKQRNTQQKQECAGGYQSRRGWCSTPRPR